MLKPAILALTSALLLAGCAMPYSPAPVATNFPSTQQARLQAGLVELPAMERSLEKAPAPWG